MIKKLELYKCEKCGNLVEVVLEGAGELVCCGEPMKLLESQKEKDEKHTPYFEKNNDGIVVKIGSIAHPMEKEHYIQFIEIYSKDKKYVKRKYLCPEEAAKLKLKCLDLNSMTARELCNIHGLWEANND